MLKIKVRIKEEVEGSGGSFVKVRNVDMILDDEALAKIANAIASQQSFAPDVAMCEDCGKSPAMEGCSVCAECGL